ncbi:MULTISPECIES: hypothetical protein [Bacillus cereus group]|uniref:hypothetical protein n=1 Tax=Bacillus cereus group TaxID=86661 RepID=UPI00077AB0FE|nr:MULTISPECIES: hypothetical protein [Bacillus cereus group]KXY39914.1 hypothetical protein AT257_22650 [Bacillus cereus]PEK91897.1 hypothetical protein CN600_20350 [Bacillus mycoides]QWG59704.1 hypothetical protein EXW60_00840 [Bacillus mycoides]QWG83597.1 hypothetical protein EXW61_08730 [Bacillus mycoides]QWG90832.1 hypothetical protein EXW40_17510 [Bacillus mycoides]
MHRQKCYNTCQRYFGKVVRIEDRDGHIHLGKIIDVTNDSVWIEPVQQRSSFDTGFGYHGAYSNGGCDICGGLSRCDNCGFGCGGGFDGGFGGCGCGRRGCGGCGFGGGWGLELGFGFIFGITLAALFFI